MKRIIILFSITILYIIIAKDSYCITDGFIRTIVIDAGHGGRDPGAVGKNSYEKNINLAIALKLGNYIEKNLPDVRVIYTRKTDVFIPLHKRAKIANENNADLFISIHCNSNTSNKIYGSETYIMGLHKSQENLEVAKLENASILQEDNYSENYEGFNPNSPEAYIIFSLYQNAHLDHSIDIASKVQQQFKDRVGLRDRGVLQAGFLVLYRITMPGILVETGYISNANDERFLLTMDGQTFVASAIYRAFKQYKLEIEQSIISSESKLQQMKQPDPSNTQGAVIFRVQVMSTDKEINLKSKRFRGLKDMLQYRHQGLFKYCSGVKKSFEAANKLKLKLQKGKFKDAFVVAFQNGTRISLNKARKLTEK